MITGTRYRILLLVVVLVYIAGLFVTLFENDSAQFAVMAMRMVQENDFINLIKGTEDYLDKPHMHFWLAALAYKIFGITDWAYRIPALFATFLGAYSCYGLGSRLYDKEVGNLAALIFMTAQTIVLSNIDVRTDAVLTGFTVFSLWQLVTYVDTRGLKNLLLGAMGAGLAFSTKGQIAILVIGLPLLCHLAYEKKWNVLADRRIVLALLVFFLVISPMLFAYYQQFDLHPEKVIRGRSHRSGILFIFWEQSFERLSGEGVGKNSSDYFFFFHTFLWVFLPWTIIGLMAFGSRLRQMIRHKFRKSGKTELLTLGGITLIFILISFAQFKLPHYLNITIPLFAILTASYVKFLPKDTKLKIWKFLLGGQYLIALLVVSLSLVLCFWVFEIQNNAIFLILISGILVLLYFSFKRESVYARLITISALSAILINFVLNLHFYPLLLQYQGGSSMSGIVQSEDIPVDKIYKLSERYTWSMDFYNQQPLKIMAGEDLAGQKDIWLYITTEEKDELKKSGYEWKEEYTVDQFRITRLQGRFLNPKTRQQVLNQMHLVHIY